MTGGSSMRIDCVVARGRFRSGLMLPILVAVTLLVAPVQTAAEPEIETVVSTETCSRLWLVPLVWNGDGENPQNLLAVFDTGGLSAFIDPDALERISGKRIKIGKRVSLKNMSVAGKAFTDFRLKVRDLDHLSRALGRELDVFLPFQAFANYLLTLDYASGEMRMVPGSLPKPNQIDVFDARGPDRRPWLKVQVGSDQRQLLIDSGSTGSLSVAAVGGLDWVTAPRPLRLFQGMSDVELVEVGRLDGSLEVGPLAFSEPVVALTQDTELIGAEVLENFILTFDQKKRRVRLQAAAESPVRLPPQQGTGAVMRQREDGFEIHHVVAGSPAEAAGLQPGDLVTHIDGLPVLERGCREFDWTDAESVAYLVRRGNQRLALDVRLEVLVP